MVCIEKRPHILYGRSSAPHFRYLTCLLDRGHIILEGFTFDNTNVASQVAAVEANIETYYNPLVNGLVDDVDATIEQFRAALESAGIQDVLDELERQKEEFIAAKAE